MAKWNCLVITLLVAASPALAEIFKCADKNGMDRYQNFPCAIDSIGSLPSGSPSASTASPAGGASRTTPIAIPAAGVATGRPAAATEPRIGMTTDEVTAIWGEPEDRSEEELREGRIETWRYAYGRSVQFSNKHRVSAVQR